MVALNVNRPQATVLTDKALSPLSYYKPATLAKIGTHNYLMVGQYDRSTVGNVRMVNGKATIELRSVMRPGGPTPVVPPPRAMSKDEIKGLVEALNRYIKKGPTNLAGFIDLRSQLRAAAKTAV